MKRFASLCLLLPVLAAAAAAQAAPVPAITSIPQRKSYAPSNVAINGTNLGLVTDVKVNGVSVPITRRTATRLVAGPLAPQDPGFGAVELVHGRGVATGALPLLPTLTGARKYTHMDLVLNNGDTGTYVLRHSYTKLGSPVVDQDFYGKRYLGIYSSVLAVGVFPDTNPVSLPGILVPLQVGIIGTPLFLQADCTADSAGLTVYSNLLEIVGFGQHQ